MGIWDMSERTHVPLARANVIFALQSPPPFQQIQNKIIMVADTICICIAQWFWWWVWWWKWRWGRLEMKRWAIAASSLSSAFPPPIIFIPASYIHRIFLISPLYRIRCGLWWWSGNGSRWDVGDVSDRSIWGACQAAPRWNGLGWNGSAAKKYFFPPQLRFKRHASAREVGWIQPKSRLRLFPGSAFFFLSLPVAFYFGKPCFSGLAAHDSELYHPMSIMSE